MNKKIIVANWKMAPESALKAKALFSAIKKEKLKDTSIVVCPPFPFLSLFSPSKGIFLGSQDISGEETVPHTGEVSAPMIKSLKASHAIIGHSERRALGENVALIGRKIKQAEKAGIIPIICIGEKERDHEGKFYNLLRDEIISSLEMVTRKFASKIIVAYEPLWAIGSSSKGAMDSSSVHETGLFIRKILTEIFGRDKAKKIPILYGGSVDPNNAGAIVKDGGVDGLLVGRDSLNPANFSAIIKALQ